MQYGLRRGWTITAPGLLCATMIAAMLMHVLTVRCRTKRFVGTATSSTHAILAEVCRVGVTKASMRVAAIVFVEAARDCALRSSLDQRYLNFRPSVRCISMAGTYPVA